MAEEIHEQLPQLFGGDRPAAGGVAVHQLAHLPGGEPAVDLLHHPARGMAHQAPHQLERDAVGEQPGARRAAQVVGRAALHARAGAGALQVVPDVGPGTEEQAIRTARMLSGVREQRPLALRHDRHAPLARVRLGPAQEDHHVAALLLQVDPPGALGGAPLRRGRDDERDARGLIGDELAEQRLQLLWRQRSLPALRRTREPGRDHVLRVPAPLPSAPGQAERRAERDEFLVDGRRGRTLAAPRGDEAVHHGADLRAGEAERAVVVVALEHAAQGGAGLLVERDAHRSPLARRYQLAEVVEPRLQDVAEGRLALGRRAGIGRVGDPSAAQSASVCLRGALGAALELAPRSVLVVAPPLRVPVGAPLVAIESWLPHVVLRSRYLVQRASGQLSIPRAPGARPAAAASSR